MGAKAVHVWADAELLAVCISPGMCSRMVVQYPSYQSEDVYWDNNGKKIQQKNLRTEIAPKAVSAHDWLTGGSRIRFGP